MSLDQTIIDAVAADGVAREVTDLDNGATYMVFRNARGLAQSCLLADWPAVEAQLAAAAAAEQQAQADAAALRQRILTLARSAEGVQVDQLTAGQLRALQYLLLWKAGALDRTGVVRPLGEWV